MADSSLQAIRQKVRRITRNPSFSQMSDAQLDEYIDTFVLYDFPGELRLFPLRKTFTFYTKPFVDTYRTLTNIADINEPLYNFKNRYVAVHPPIFLAGIQSFYTQQRDLFYGYYPQTNTIADTQLVGDGTIGPFAGTVTAHPMLQNNVIFTCTSLITNEPMILIDYPVSSYIGAMGIPGVPMLAPGIYGQINYVTGVYSISFPALTVVGAPITVENIAYQPGKPVAMLYYDNTFTIRPVPDKVYSVQMEVDVRPTELLAAAQSPDIEQWWQFIALGASRSIFIDKLDMDSLAMIEPEYRRQEVLALRTTLTQQANERTTTIYTVGKAYTLGGWGGTWRY